jgi:hypothetical protein
VTTPVRSVQHVCSANELQQARAACNQPGSSGCQSFFAFEQSTNPSCAACLAPFNVPWSEVTGILECAAPFVDATCNHLTGCFTDCEDQSCAQCPASGASQCRSDVQSNQCSSEAGDLTCAYDALFGPASFCDPQSYPSYGGWLQGVGGHFCGP